jgi:hypothetical protein
METPPALSVFANQAYDNDGLPIAFLNIIWNEQLCRHVGTTGGG